jgi:hypothetical protein
MGNSPSSTSPVYISPDVKWKSGSRTSTIPSEISLRDGESSSGTISSNCIPSYEQLIISSEFKNHLLENLDSDYLVSSVLTVDAVHEEKILLEGIRILNSPDPGVELDILQQVKTFGECLVAGVEVRGF